ncbi:hypothetical protein DTO282F9_6835 [Paecilomyces variotii]|nr:hypothetical protein DTO282F9_6835 [Paecilomyces variotii]
MSVDVESIRKQPADAMPSPPRDRGRPKTRSSETEFVLFIRGIPAHCRWQELKDLVRQTALHIRQAVVYDDQHGFPTGLGQIIVKNEDEAWRTYHRLASSGWDGQSLTVTLSRTSSPTRPIAGPTKSPPCVAQPVYIGGYSPPRVTGITTPSSSHSAEMPTVPPTPTYHHQTEYGPIPSATTIAYPPALPMASVSVPASLMINGKGPMPALSPVATVPSPLYDSPNFPTFPYSPSWLPSAHDASNRCFATGRRTSYQRIGSERNHQSGYNRHRTHSMSPTYYTPSRYVFIQNVAPQTEISELKTYLSAAGTVEHCEILEDRRTGRRRSQAKATFQTTEQAKQAMAKLDNTMLEGARIRVKFDRDAPVSCSSEDTVPFEDKDQIKADTSTSTSGDERRGSTSSSKDSKCEPFVVNGSVVGKKTKDITNGIAYESK